MFLLFKVFGLPAHALAVHAAVVLVPLGVGGLAVTGWRPAWRRHFGVPVTLAALGGALFAFISSQTGGPLQSAIREAAQGAGTRARFGEHPEQGDTAMAWAITFAVAALAVFAIDRWGARLKLPAWAPSASYAAALLPGAIALVTIAIAGHSGAQLVWKDVGTFTVAR